MALAFLFFLGLMSSGFMSLNMTRLQRYANPDMRGRVISISMMTFGLMTLSAVPFGALAERIGTPNALGVSGRMLTLFTIIFAASHPGFRKTD